MENNLSGAVDSLEKKHVRRVRYNGTHPKKFNEKYKELHPEKYAEEIEKIIQSGKTPAGMHISICVKEILDFLQIKPGQIGLDATLGFGGHCQKMLECLQDKGHLYAIDVDSVEMVKTKKRLENLGYGPEILTVKQLNFANIDQILENDEKFDFILADLGLSSMQIDNPDRGFSFKHDGPLDLRLNSEKGITAAQKLKEFSQQELEEILVENSDEPYAKQISIAVTSAIKRGVEITTTKQLTEIIVSALHFLKGDDGKKDVKKSCQRTFQALRIEINSEFDVLTEFLHKLPSMLTKNGRVAILTFHSGEDRLVKKSFKLLHNENVYSMVARYVTLASPEECRANPRAHSAKLRWAIKV